MSRGGRRDRRRVLRWWRNIGGCYCGKHTIDWSRKGEGLVTVKCPHVTTMLGPVWSDGKVPPKKVASRV